jgi:shikimate kinase
MGSGKTSIGSRVADRMGRPFVDGDEELERRTGGRTAADVEAADGIDTLHALEEEIAVAALRRTEPSVVGPAASVAESQAVRELLADETVVWLSAPPEHLAAGARSQDHRPLVDAPDLTAVFEEQLARRLPAVSGIVDLTVDVTTGSKDELAETIVRFVEQVRG